MSPTKICVQCQATVYTAESSLCMGCLSKTIASGKQAALKLLEEPLPYGAQLQIADQGDMTTRFALVTNKNTNPKIVYFLTLPTIEPIPEIRHSAILRADINASCLAVVNNKETNEYVLKAVRSRLLEDGNKQSYLVALDKKLITIKNKLSAMQEEEAD